jgi:hypothetical protein
MAFSTSAVAELVGAIDIYSQETALAESDETDQRALTRRALPIRLMRRRR